LALEGAHARHGDAMPVPSAFYQATRAPDIAFLRAQTQGKAGPRAHADGAQVQALPTRRARAAVVDLSS